MSMSSTLKCDTCSNTLLISTADGSTVCAVCNKVSYVGGRTQYVEEVSSPAHYNQGKVEVIDAIESWGLDFCLGNVVKYVARAEHKGERAKDLKKALWYLERVVRKQKN